MKSWPRATRTARTHAVRGLLRAGVVRVALGAATVGALPALAPGQAAGDLDAAVDATLTQIGGLGRIGSANVRQVARLTGLLVARARLFDDLYAYDLAIVRDYARLRESLARAGGPPVPAAAYFLGRALQDAGAPSEAASAYRRVGPAAPAAFRALAKAWSATLSPGGPRTWQRNVVDWRAGRPVTPLTPCPPATPQCDLFRAVVTADVNDVVRLRAQLARAPQPEYSVAARDANGPFTIEFHDPLLLYLLSQADYALAAHALAGRPDAAAARAVTLVRANRLAEAEPLLRAAASPGAPPSQESVALGELLYRTGRRAEAEELWRVPDGPLASLVADVRGALEGATSTLPQQLRRFLAAAESDAEAMRGEGAGGAYLARALLRAGRPHDALAVLQVVRPASVGSDLGLVPGYVLALVSHARYAAGQTGAGDNNQMPLARGELAALANVLPIARPMLKQLQEISAPSHVPELRAR